MESLPADVVRLILGRLAVGDLGRLACVDRRMRDLVQRETTCWQRAWRCHPRLLPMPVWRRGEKYWPEKLPAREECRMRILYSRGLEKPTLHAPKGGKLLKPVERFKFVVVGDKKVGKTSLLLTFGEGSFPKFIHAFNYTGVVNHRYKTIPNPYEMSLWDTAGDTPEDNSYARLRPLSYQGTTVFLLTFSVASRSSFERLWTVYFPEIHTSDFTDPDDGYKFILVATMTDLRCHEDASDCISTEEALSKAKEFNCEAYMETSALFNEGVQTTINTALDVALGLDCMGERIEDGDHGGKRCIAM